MTVSEWAIENYGAPMSFGYACNTAAADQLPPGGRVEPRIVKGFVEVMRLVGVGVAEMRVNDYVLEPYFRFDCPAVAKLFADYHRKHTRADR